MSLKVTFESWKCNQQPVLVRADLNVPIVDGTILSDRRLVGVQPTLDALLKKEAIIILTTHLGRPDGKEEHLSARQLMPWFEKREYRILFCDTISKAKEAANLAQPGSIVLLENMRFFPGEKKNDLGFAQELHGLADWYVLDAFGTLHRNDASLATVAKIYAPSKRSIGYLIEKELFMLNKIFNNPQYPITFILGGGKLASKLPLIKHLLDLKIENLLLCPALVFTFELATGKHVGRSLIDIKEITVINEILKKAELMCTNFVYPVDYQVAKGSLEGPLSIVKADQFPQDSVGISIGPETLKLFNSYIKKSGTIFYNGMMGLSNRPETLHGVETLLADISSASGFSIVAGGDSGLIVDKLALNGIDYCSTGGGATLTYLSEKKLPALEPFFKKSDKSQ